MVGEEREEKGEKGRGVEKGRITWQAWKKRKGGRESERVR